MLWISEHQRIWRMSVLGLLLVAILGPWAFDRIMVPAEFPCYYPDIRLEGDFCGGPLSGIWMLWAIVSEFINRVVGLIMGEVVLTDLGVGLGLILGALLLVLPFFSTLLLILVGNRRHQQIFNIAAWGLAAALAC